MIILFACVAALVLYLVYERVSLTRTTRVIPLRIAVTGTRGKSSVTRMLSSVLRASGRSVVAKTSGSEARILWPDGHETNVLRRGVASIIEQKTLIRRAAAAGADCVIAEVMSIHPDNHYVESQQILQPHIVVITNARPDHVDAMGETDDDVASVLSLDITPKATVFVPAGELRAAFRTAVDRARGTMVDVPAGTAPSMPRRESPENVDLVYAVGRHLEIEAAVIERGIAAATRDVGALDIWEYRPAGMGKRHFIVNAFAANDPTSTLQVIRRVRDLLPEAPERFAGLLCLRTDRGDRTVQWIEALRNGMAQHFGRVFVTGGHARVAAKKLQAIRLANGMSAEQITETVTRDLEDGTVVFGFGNIVGEGRQLVEYWSQAGVAHEL
jgi:poly-gamma-glutamate synthase PgsB/CapB